MIYVDTPKEYDPKRTGLRFRYWSHMWSSTNDVTELLAFADKLGLRRDWLQDKKRKDGYRLPHFDVVPSKRDMALRYGAQKMELSEFLRQNDGIYPPVVEADSQP